MVNPSKKKKRTELDNAEKRFNELIEKRNEMNEEAKILREERNRLNEEKKGLFDKVEDHKQKRDGYVAVMREHKFKRNELQKRAKELITIKRERTSDVKKTLPNDILEVEAEIQLLDHKQQTVPMSLDAEKEVIDKIKVELQRLVEMQKTLSDQDKTIEELDKVNRSITELFEMADKEHELVQKNYDLSQEEHAKVTEIYNEISYLIGEANKKHEKFIKTRERADRLHQRAMDMRSKVLSIKREGYLERKAARDLIDEQNKMVRDTLNDEEEFEKSIEDSLEMLKKSGKITIGQ